MGTDKALVAVDGVPMAARVAAALRAAGADPVVAVGGGASAAPPAPHGLPMVADRWPGSGPLGGLTSALSCPALADAAVVVVAPCDQPWLDAATVTALVDALLADPGAVGAAARTADGRLQLLPGAWRPSIAGPLAALVEAGARRLDRAADLGRIVAVTLADERPLADVDTPDQLRPP